MGPMGPMGGDLAVVARFDVDKNGVLDAEERAAARPWIKANRPQRGGPGGRGGRGLPGPRFAGGGEPPADDRRGGAVDPATVPTFPDADLFAPDALRTWFLTFPDDGWYGELSDFYRTDVDVPAVLRVDGQEFRDVGVHFRGNTSYMMARGKKKSLHLDFNHMHKDQRVHGHRAVNLINNNEDPTLLHEALGAFLANRHAVAPRATLARLVVNGEDLGVYSLVEHFDKDLTDALFGSKKGARFKVPPDFSGGGALVDKGSDTAAYARNYQLKSDEDPAAWQRLVALCQLLARATDQELVTQLPDLLAIDQTLWFLAIDNALLDGDGYYGRGSDYALYLDPDGRFHPLARDGNEVLGTTGGGGFGMPPGGFRGRGDRRGGDDRGAPPDPRGGLGAEGSGPDQSDPDQSDPDPSDPDGRRRGGRGPARRGRGGRGPGGPGGPGGMGGPGMHPSVEQGALAMLAADDRPLIHRLLRIPAWQQRYLAFLHTFARDTLDWQTTVGPRVAAWRTVLDPLVQQDVHSLTGYEEYVRVLGEPDAKDPQRTLRGLLAARRDKLLADPALQGPWPAIAEVGDAFAGGVEGKSVLHVTARAEHTDATAPVATMTLHLGLGNEAAFSAMAMRDDGQHGDGAAQDHVFGVTVGDLPPGKKVRFWVEARTETGRVACAPTSAGARPLVRRVPKANGK